MRRKPGDLTPYELELLRTAVGLATRGMIEAHGWQLAKEREAADPARKQLGFGTIYRALDKLEEMGFLASKLEDATIAEEERRPRRRLYRVTAIGYQVPTAAEASKDSTQGKVLRPIGTGAKP